MNATSTHDTKRGEDVRARINVISEIPGEWEGRLALWRKENSRFKTSLAGLPCPDPNDEYFIYGDDIYSVDFDSLGVIEDVTEGEHILNTEIVYTDDVLYAHEQLITI